jgi:polar amino acid transport system permease protein
VSVPDRAGAVVTDDRPGPIDAVPVRHPGRWVAVAVIVVLALMFLHLTVTNDRFNW